MGKAVKLLDLIPRDCKGSVGAKFDYDTASIRETAAVLPGTSCSLGLGKKLPAKQKRNLSHFVLLFWTAGVFSDEKEHKAQTTLDQK